MMDAFQFTLLAGAAAFVFVLALTPAFASFLKGRGIIGRDVNKDKKPAVAEMGGAIVVFAFLAAHLAYSFIFQSVLSPLFYPILLIALFGAADYFLHFKPRHKLIVPLLASVLALPAVSQSMHTPFGVLYLGSFAYALFVVSFTAIPNLTNMLAGFNGLEAGLGAVMTFSLAAVAFFMLEPAAFFSSFILFTALLAFLFYNKYPARVFPGDVLTMSIGAVLTLTAFRSGLELYLFVLLLPHFSDAALKFWSAGIMSREGRAPLKMVRGKLRMPKGGYMSLARVFVSRNALDEKELVAKLINIELILSLVTIFLGLV